MKMSEIVVDLDYGLTASFVKYIEHKSEDGYKYYVYCPFNSFPAKEITAQKPVHKDNIFELTPFMNLKGVPIRLVVIYRGGPDSLFGARIERENLQIIRELKEKVKTLEMRNASLMQEVENARSGVSKSFASLKGIQKSTEENRPASIFDRIGRGGFGGSSDLDE